MKLTEELKDKVDKTKTKEEAKQTIENSGMILDDAELDQVSGGDVLSAGGTPRVFPDPINISGEYESPL